MLFPTVYYRFLVLFFNCLLTFGSYFCFDIPSVLQDQFQGVSGRSKTTLKTPSESSYLTFE